MPDHAACSICRDIPDVSRAFWVGDELRSEGLPTSAGQLEVVGAPFFKDEMVSSRTILKRCPECGTYYEWHYEYEYLAGGSEDDLVLTRLSDEEGQRREQAALEIIEAAHQEFKERAEMAFVILRESSDPAELEEALRVFSYACWVQGFDISFALPAFKHTAARLLGRRGDKFEKVLNEMQLLLMRFK